MGCITAPRVQSSANLIFNTIAARLSQIVRAGGLGHVASAEAAPWVLLSRLRAGGFGPTPASTLEEVTARTAG